MKISTLAATLISAAFSATLFAAAPGGYDWPQFRGPQGRGTLDGFRLADHWSTENNVVWKTAIPGHGWSSPIIVGDRIFVVSAISEGPFKEPSAGIFGNGTIAQMIKDGKSAEEASDYISDRDTESVEEAGELRRVIYCLDLATGGSIWSKELHVGRPTMGRHRKNTYASETPAADGERVFVAFSGLGIWALSLDGEELWHQEIEPQQVYLDFGGASSLAADEENLYFLFDNEEESYLSAFDKKTGALRWRNVRGVGPGNSGWSTPLVWHHDGTREIVTTGSGRGTSYSPNGEVLWQFEGLSRITAPIPVATDHLVVLSTGSTSEPKRALVAVRSGARGNITLEQGKTSSSAVAWYAPKAGTYIPTPLIYGNRLYALYDKGFFAAFDLETGDRKFMARVSRGGNTFSASPWAYDGKIFLLSETGTTFVVEAADEFRLMHTNDLDELTLATPALHPQGLFIRTNQFLYRIAATR